MDNVYFTREQVENTPSGAHGIDYETETTWRIAACDLIQEAGMLLRCNQAVMATGQVLFHRFFCRKSMKEYSPKVGICR